MLQVACTREGIEPVAWNVVMLHLCVCVCVSYCCCDSLVWTRSPLSSHISLDMFIVVSYVILLLACFWCRSCLKHHNVKTEAASCCQMCIYIWHSCSGHYDKNVSLAWQLTWWCDTTGVIKLHIVARKDVSFRSYFPIPSLVEDMGLMWCDAVSLGEYFLTFPSS